MHVTDSSIWYCLRARSGIWFEKVIVHSSKWSPRQVFTPFSLTRGDDCDLCPSCSVRTNLRKACVLLHVLPFLLQQVCFLGLLSLSSLQFLRILLLHSVSLFICHRILTFFQTVQHLLCTTLFTLTRLWPYRFVTLEPLTVLAS